jgi:hypothetical protein
MYYNRDSGDVAYRHQPISPLLSFNDGRVHFEESHSEAASATLHDTRAHQGNVAAYRPHSPRLEDPSGS